MRVWPVLWRFLAVGVIWGSSFLWNAIALQSMSWQFLSWARFLIGAVTLTAIMLIARPRSGNVVWPRSVKTWLHFGVVGVLLAVVPNVFFAIAQLTVSASLASIYNATVPIATAIVAGILFRVDTLGTRQWLGVAVGLTGVVVVIGPWEASLEGGLVGQLCCLVAAFSAAAAFSYQRKYLREAPLHPTTVAALLTIGAGVVALSATPVWAVWPVDAPPMAWFALLWLGALVSGVAYIWNARVVESWGATGASMVTYLSPVIGVTLGVIVLGDSLTWHAPLGGLIIVAGIALSQSRSSSRISRATNQVID